MECWPEIKSSQQNADMPFHKANHKGIMRSPTPAMMEECCLAETKCEWLKQVEPAKSGTKSLEKNNIGKAESEHKHS